MKCYRCGEESPEPAPTREELGQALQLATIGQVQLQESLRQVTQERDEILESERYQDIAELEATAKTANEEALESWSRVFAARPLIEALEKLLADRVIIDKPDGPLLRGCREWLTGKDAAEIAHVRTCPDCGKSNTMGASTVAAAERITELEKQVAVGIEWEETAEEQARTIEELRAELRRYEPSDAVMYRLHDYHEHAKEAAGLLEAQQALNYESHPDIAAWLERQQQRFTKSPVYPLQNGDATILALHTVIDEARRLFDEWESDTEQVDVDRWKADVNAWRHKVLVQRTRETVTGEVKRLNDHYTALEKSTDHWEHEATERAKQLHQLAEANARQAAEIFKLKEDLREAGWSAG